MGLKGVDKLLPLDSWMDPEKAAVVELKNHVQVELILLPSSIFGAASGPEAVVGRDMDVL